MIIIADSGSTKTEWWTISEGEVIARNKTKGFNPYYQSEEFISNEIRDTLKPKLDNPSSIKAIYFYGSGCSTQLNRDKIENAIHHSIPHVQVDVEHDLLAAARATCGNEPGISCILGTGSNSCQYDGEVITDHVPSLGFLLADEGSGMHLGKQLIRDYLLEEMPQKLRNQLSDEFRLELPEVLHKLYQESMPNKYLASFSTFILANIEQPYMHDIALNSFNAFLRNYIIKYPNYSSYLVHFVGSIAFHFKPLIEEACIINNLRLGSIMKGPLAGLVNFHQNLIH